MIGAWDNMQQTVATFEVRFTQFLGPEGTVVMPLPPFAEDPMRLIELYRAMVLTRRFDAKCVVMQRTGRMGTFPTALGQEAVGVAIGDAMIPQDILAPTYREANAQHLRGVSLEETLLFYAGDERGSDYANAPQDFPASLLLGTHTLHAAGAATALKVRGGGRAVLCVFGDGATSKGDFYEAMNVAGVWALPLVFVIVNNGWAISVPRELQTKAETLAQKGIAAGIPSQQVDGNDVIAVRHVIGEALKRARTDEGPSLIEAVTYRLGDHSTADDARRYRDAEEVSARWKEEPVARLRTYLVSIDAWTKEDEVRMIEEIDKIIDKAVAAYEAIPPQRPESMFDHLFADLPVTLAEQRAEVITAEGRDG